VSELRLDPASVQAVADALAAQLLPEVVSAIAAMPRNGGWLDSQGAAKYLGVTKPALDKLAAQGRVAFSQETQGGKRYFRAADLDDYREAHLQPATCQSPATSA
jgi:excisionase family DNA binding protein